MWQYIKELFDLILSPSHGWNEISYRGVSPKEIFHRGLVPLLGVTAVTSFVGLCYKHGTFIYHIQNAAIEFGTLFASYFISCIMLESLLVRVIDGKVNPTKCQTVSVYGIGLVAIFILLENCMPINFGFMKILPVFISLVLFKAAQYLGVKKDSEVAYICIITISTVLIPLTLIYALNMLISH